MTVKELIKRAWTIAEEKGFHEANKKDADTHCLVMAITELGEMKEAHRQGKIFANTNFDLKTIEESDDFVSLFKNTVKDTMEDEIADVAIWVMDHMGIHDIEYNKDDNDDDIVEFYKTNLNCFFMEVCYHINDCYFYIEEHDAISQNLNIVLNAIFKIPYMRDHIELKLKYNETRDKLHGKAY